jgi:hypothetical protein
MFLVKKGIFSLNNINVHIDDSAVLTHAHDGQLPGDPTSIEVNADLCMLYCSHAIQILEKTQSEAFLNSQQTDPEIQISQRTFEKCKPYFVRAARIKDRTICCCRYHLECKYLFNVFIAYRKQLIDGVIDETSFKLYGSLTELCNDTLCYQENRKMSCKRLHRKILWSMRSAFDKI